MVVSSLHEDKEMTGIVKWFSPQKGFGFILVPGREDVFVHHEQILQKGFRTLNAGDHVEFQLTHDSRGDRAEKLIVTKHAPPERTLTNVHHE